MLRLPAVAGQFYPANPQELAAFVRRLTNQPNARGTSRLEDVEAFGAGISRVVAAAGEEVLIVATTDVNHSEDETTTRKKDALAISQLEAMNAGKLYEVCRSESISMCGLGSAV